MTTSLIETLHLFITQENKETSLRPSYTLKKVKASHKHGWTNTFMQESYEYLFVLQVDITKTINLTQYIFVGEDYV